MVDAPRITAKGAGSARETAMLAQTLQVGVVMGLQHQRGPLHIDRLQLQLPRGASQADVAAAVTRAIAAKQGQR